MKRILFLTSEKTGSTLLVSALLSQNGFFGGEGIDGSFQNPEEPVWIKTIPEKQCKFYYNTKYNLNWVKNRKTIYTSEAYRTYPSGVVDPEFYNQFPDPPNWKFIYLFRDPRNRTASKSHRHANWVERTGGNYDDAFSLLFHEETKVSMYEMRSIMKIWNDPRFYLLQSEKLFANPLEEFKKVWNFIGFNIDEEYYRELFNKQVKHFKLSTFKDNGKNSNKRWELWSNKYKKIFKEKAGKELIEFGYENDYNW